MTSSSEKILFLFESNKDIDKRTISRMLQRDINLSVIVLEDYAKKIDLLVPLKSISEYYDLRKLRDRVDEVCTLTLMSLLEDPVMKSTFTIGGTFYFKIIREDLGYVLTSLIRQVLVVERIIAIEKPSRIVVFEGNTFLSSTLEIPLGKTVALIARKYSIKVIIKHHPLSIGVQKLKLFFANLFFLKKRFKIYTLVRIKSLFLNADKKPLDYTNTENKKVLFIPFSDAERAHLKLVVERLCTIDGISCVAIPYPEDIEYSKNGKNKKGIIRILSFGEFRPRKMRLAKERYIEVMKVWRQNSQLFYASQALMFNGVSLGELMKEKLDLLIKCWFRECLDYFFVTKEIIRREKPHCIVTSKERWLFMRAVLEAIHQERIPSVCVQHGIYYDSWLWDPVDVTRICVDETFKEILIKRGEDPQKIVVTGASVYEDLFRKINENSDSIKERLGLDRRKKYLCFLTSLLPEWSTDEKRVNLLKSIITSIEKADYDLIVRLHPRESKRKIQDLIATINTTKDVAMRIKVISFEEADLFDVVLASDIVIGVRTSALVAAMLAKKPVILVNFEVYITDFFPKIEDSIFGVAKSNIELSNITKDLMNDPSKAKDSLERAETYAKKYAPDSDATNKVVANILDLSKK